MSKDRTHVEMELILKVLLITVIVGAFAYLLPKLLAHLRHPFSLSRAVKEIATEYSDSLASIDTEINSATDMLKRWRSGDKVVRTLYDEDQLIRDFSEAKTKKEHEQAVHEKFVRLQERYLQQPKKLSEAIVVYHRYLEIKRRQRRDVTFYANAATSEVVTFDELTTSTRETMIMLEENEKKLDGLLSQ